MYHANVNVNLMREKVINQWWNNNKCQCEWKNIVYVKNVTFGTLVHVFVKMENIVVIMDDLVIVCDEIIEETLLTNFNEKEATCKTWSFYILLAFLLITIALLIALSKTKTFITISQHK